MTINQCNHHQAPFQLPFVDSVRLKSIRQSLTETAFNHDVGVIF